jgi:hypothetical protein
MMTQQKSKQLFKTAKTKILLSQSYSIYTAVTRYLITMGLSSSSCMTSNATSTTAFSSVNRKKKHVEVFPHSDDNITHFKESRHENEKKSFLQIDTSLNNENLTVSVIKNLTEFDKIK